VAGIDAVGGHAENNDVRKLTLEGGLKFARVRTFHGDEAEIFDDLGKECAKMFLAVHNTRSRHHFSAAKSGVSCPIVSKALFCHFAPLRPMQKEALAARMVSNMEIVARRFELFE
jgi:hypothetical protein